MATIQGFKGSIKIGADAVAEMNEWDMDVDRDILEKTSFDDYDGSTAPFKTFVGGLRGATGKFSGNLDMTDATGQLALWNSMGDDDPVSLDLYVDVTHKFSMDLFISKWSGKTPVADLETVEFSFTVTDAVTFA